MNPISRFLRSRIKAAQAATSALLRRLTAKHRIPDRCVAKSPTSTTSTLESTLITASDVDSTRSSPGDSPNVDDCVLHDSKLLSLFTRRVSSHNIADEAVSTPQVVDSSDAEAKPTWLLTLDRMGKDLPAAYEVWESIDYSDAVVPTLDPSVPLEEEMLDEYIADRYYPVVSGDVFNSRYQVIQKMGYGVTSTVWLARDLQERCHVALKICINDPSLLVNTGVVRELEVYEHLKQGPTAHPGNEAIRAVLDSFKITGPAGEHQCITYPPLWGDFRGVRSDKKGRFSTTEIASLLKRMLEAIDYVHECKVVHT
ncbi:hypothetical protein H0H93_009902, partial [Arthromyces matolae]